MTPQSRIKWKTVAFLAMALAGVVVACLFVGKMRERKPFVSRVVAGYRYRCTLSTDWKPMSNVKNSSQDEAEDYDFFAPPSPMRAWIAKHLFHSASPKGNPMTRSGRPQLHLTSRTEKAKQIFKIVSGYPELDLDLRSQFASGIKAIPSKHFRIGNCPATMTGLDLTALKMNGHYRIVLVCTPDYTNTYVIAGAGEARDSEQIEREIQAVVASFHVEKVAAAGGKR